MSNWIERLRNECDVSSQGKVAKTLRQEDGFPSSGTINRVLNGSYPSRKGLERMRALVETLLSDDKQIELHQPGITSSSRTNTCKHEISDWIEVLKHQCTEKSQSKVAAELRQRDGFPSPTIINQVINSSYPSTKGRNRLRGLVEGHFMGVSVTCPILGEIGLDKCANWQAQPYMAVNPLRTQMHRACRTCPNRREEQ